MEYLFHLSEGVALLRDPLQYIVAQPIRRARPEKGVWRPVFFTRFGQETLLRHLSRRGFEPSPEALARISAEVPTDAEVLQGERRLRRDPDAPDPSALRQSGSASPAMACAPS
jgi:hypothetical protein